MSAALATVAVSSTVDKSIPSDTARIVTVTSTASPVALADTCLGQLPGDVNGNTIIGEIGDANRLLLYLAGIEPAPTRLSNADPNGDCRINYQDYYYIRNYMSGGPAPVTCTCVEPKKTCCVEWTGNVDKDPEERVDISDLSALIDHLFISLTPLTCPQEADCDGQLKEGISISDLSAMIANLFISFAPLPECR
ncbi:MAG: hypothetical protein HY851_01920 [candidate division Zixibacteria bacterium]|nr:hypothetical protein [candidate division Zixibacteria bacterium]